MSAAMICFFPSLFPPTRSRYARRRTFSLRESDILRDFDEFILCWSIYVKVSSLKLSINNPEIKTCIRFDLFVQNRMFDLLASFHHFRHEMMLAPKPLPFPPPPTCSPLPSVSTELDKNGLEFFCYQKKLFSGVTPDPAKGSKAVTVWSNGSPIETYVEGKGKRAAIYERCPVTMTPEHRAYQLAPPCTYVDPADVPTDTLSYPMTW
jgi:hypothetical protein